jgi:DNA polymerase
VKYHLDFETFSEADIRKVGTFGYARHPSTQILCLAISREDREPLLWVPPLWADLPFIDPIEQDEALDMIWDMILDRESVVYAHNAPFEYAIWNNVMAEKVAGIKPVHGKVWFDYLRPEQMRCTAAMARRACIPHSLEKCAAYLGLVQQKDTKGKSLIQKLCIPQKPDKDHAEVWRRTPTMDPVRFRALCEYCVQDVKVEMQVEKALHLFDAAGLSHDVFVHDLIINERGFPVDLPALKRADAMIDEVTAEAHEEFVQLTGFAPTQTKVLLPWLQEHGYTGANLQAGTMEDEMEEWSPPTPDQLGGLDKLAKRALELRQTISFAAVKKVKSMLLLADPEDSRIRGTLFYHGASTGRWSSKLVQQQNLKRSTKDSEDAFAMLRSGAPMCAIELVHGPILQTLATCIRHFINDGDEPLDSVDYAAIEARIVCWLAGQEDALEEFRQGIDRYKVMAAKIFRTTIAHITKDQRFVGKQTVLGCGYGMGANKFIGTCESYGETVSVEVAELAVNTFRETHKQVTSLWYKLEGACKRAILTPGQKIKVGDHLTVFCMTTAGKRFLMIRLPSGRHLSFPEPRIETKLSSIQDEFASKWGQPAQTTDRITFYGQIPGKAIWGRIETYGGKLVENVTQGVAADCMGVGAINATKAGHNIIMLVHDEAVRTTRGSAHTLEHFIKCLTDMPAWAEGLPLVAEGETIPWYRK